MVFRFLDVCFFMVLIVLIVSVGLMVNVMDLEFYIFNVVVESICGRFCFLDFGLVDNLF